MTEQLREAQEAHARYLSELEQTATGSRARRAGEGGGGGGGGAQGLRRAAPEEGATPEDEPAMIVLTDAALPTESRVAVLRRLAASLSRRLAYIAALLR